NVSVFKILDNKSLEPGQEAHWTWNNANYGKSFFLEVLPLDVGSTATGFTHTTELEITRQWRKLITQQKKSSGDIGATGSTELEIHYVVKNVGKITAKYDVHLVQVG
ncbi:MAG TPA: hypothetical protein VFT45_16270, partial [Longimicrobium sp.]|nr:hypothetical protein [Longimicrobium sp.]